MIRMVFSGEMVAELQPLMAHQHRKCVRRRQGQLSAAPECGAFTWSACLELLITGLRYVPVLRRRKSLATQTSGGASDRGPIATARTGRTGSDDAPSSLNRSYTLQEVGHLSGDIEENGEVRLPSSPVPP